MSTIHISTPEYDLTLENSELIPATEKELRAIVEKAIKNVQRDVSKATIKDVEAALERELRVFESSLAALKQDAEQYVLSLRPKDGRDGQDYVMSNDDYRFVIESVLDELPDPTDGEDGYTPVKYIDYFTEKDIEEVALSVESQLMPVITEETKAETLRDKLEGLEGDERLDASAIKNLPKMRMPTMRNTNRLRDLVDVNPVGEAGSVVTLQADGTFNMQPAASPISDTDDVAEGTTNLYYTDERVDDRVSDLLQPGTNIDSITYDDAAGTITVNASNQTTPVEIPTDTRANIVALTPDVGTRYYATDTKQLYVYTADGWRFTQIPLSLEEVVGSVTPGDVTDTPTNYQEREISDVGIYWSSLGNCHIEEADVRFSKAGGLSRLPTSSGEYIPRFYDGNSWGNILINFNATQDANFIAEFTAVGKSEAVELHTGNSNTVGSNGRPIIQAYEVDPGGSPASRIFSGNFYDGTGWTSW